MNASLVMFGVALAGGLGAVARWLLDGLISTPGARPFPLGIMIINVSGSALLGWLTGATSAGVVPVGAWVILGAGFCGGYTTFSTASYDTVTLYAEHRLVAGLLNGVGMLVAALAAAAGGLALGLSM